MLCIGITKRTNKGFSLVELMTVVAIIALLSAVVGRTLADQLDQQRLADAVDQARFIASVLSPIHDLLVDPNLSCAFNDGYQATLKKFMADMNTSDCLPIRNALLGDVNLNEDVLGQSVGNVYQIQFAKHAVFVSLKVDSSKYGNEYSDIDFYAAHKTVDNQAGKVIWTVGDYPIDFSSPELTRLSNINNAQ